MALGPGGHGAALGGLFHLVTLRTGPPAELPDPVCCSGLGTVLGETGVRPGGAGGVLSSRVSQDHRQCQLGFAALLVTRPGALQRFLSRHTLNSFNPPGSPTGQTRQSSSHVTHEKTDTERFRSLPEVTQLVSGKAGGDGPASWMGQP